MTRARNVKGVNHIGVAVSDISQALSYYEKATALPRAQVARINPSRQGEVAAGFQQPPPQVAVIQGPNTFIELQAFAGSAGNPASVVPVQGPGVTHLCYQCPVDYDAYSKFTNAGGIPVSRGDAPVDLGGYGVYYAYIRDHDGIMLEVEQIEQAPFEGNIWLAHLALVTPDLDRLVGFYTRLLGTEPYNSMNKLTGPRADEVTDLDNVLIRAAWFNVGNMVLEIWQYVNPVTPEPKAPRPFEQNGYNKLVFEVDNLRQMFESLQDSVNFLSAPVEADGIVEVFARDPDGNLFGLIQLPEDSNQSIRHLQAITWM